MMHRGGTGDRRGRRCRIMASSVGNHRKQQLQHRLVFSFGAGYGRRSTARAYWRARRDTTWIRPACPSREAR